MVIEVFKTDIKDAGTAEELVMALQHHMPGSRINVDMHDCDRVLRIQSSHVNIPQVIHIAGMNGVHCMVLE